MKITPVKKALIIARNAVTNPKAAEFAKNTVCAMAVETTLKASFRPTFIYCDKHANKQSKKYAATKEFLYQTFCLGLYLSLINPVKDRVYKLISKKMAAKNPEDKRKLDLYDSFQSQIKQTKDKNLKKQLQNRFTHLLHTNKDYHFGKGVKELSSILSTVFILAICAPITSQLVLHPVMDLIFKKKQEDEQSNSPENNYVKQIMNNK